MRYLQLAMIFLGFAFANFTYRAFTDGDWITARDITISQFFAIAGVALCLWLTPGLDQ